MVARTDLNPSLSGVLKRLKAETQKTSTVPNGVNILDAEGAIEIYDPLSGELAIRLAPGDSLFTGRITVQEGSTVPQDTVTGLSDRWVTYDATTATVGAITTVDVNGDPIVPTGVVDGLDAKILNYDATTGKVNDVTSTVNGSTVLMGSKVQAGSLAETALVQAMQDRLATHDSTTNTLAGMTLVQDNVTVIDGGKIATGSVVANTIDAVSVGAGLMTAGTLQTSATPDTTGGVRISQTGGIQSWASDGRVVVDVPPNSADITLAGRYRSAPLGDSQVLIVPSRASYNERQLAIWFTPDGEAPGFGNVDGYVGGFWMENIPSTSTAYPLSVRGQSGGGLRMHGNIQMMPVTVGGMTSLPQLYADGELLISGNGGTTIYGGSYGITLQPTAGAVTVAYADLTTDGNINMNGGVLRSNTGRVLMDAEGITFDPVSGFIPLIYADNTMRVESASYLDLKSFGGVRVMTRDSPLRLTDYGGGYGYTTTSGSNLYQNGTDGRVYRVSSGSKYKKNPTIHALNEAYLDLPTFDWTDAAADAEFTKRGLDRSKKPKDPEDLAVWMMAQRRIVGTMAEEAFKVVPELVVLDADGNPDAYEYERDGSMLRPFVKRLWDNDKAQDVTLADLVKRVESLEGKKATRK